MQLVVAGGTGFIGRHLCGELAGRGHDVTALSRSPADATLPDGVDAVAADVSTYDDLPDVMAGMDGVINLVSLSPLFRPSGGSSRHQQVHLEGTRNLVRAAATADVARFVQLSGIGADPDAPTAFLRAKGRAEEVVRASDRDWIIFRPAVVFGDGGEFFEFLDLLTTPYLTALPGGGHTPFQPIWVEDLVPMIADATVDTDREGERYTLGGPTVHTLGELTRMYYRARGQSVRIVPIPMPLARLGLTVAGPLPFVPFGADQYRSLELDHTTPDNDIGTFGRSPEDLRTVEEYLTDAVGADAEADG